MPMIPITTKEHFFLKVLQGLTDIIIHHGEENRPVDMGPYVDYVITGLDGKFNPDCFKNDLVAYLIMNEFQQPYSVTVWGPDQVVLKVRARPDEYCERVLFHMPPPEVPSELAPPPSSRL